MEGFDKTIFKSSAEWLLNKGYAFDLISDKQVQAVKGNGALLQTGGVNYRTIVLTDVKFIPLETMVQLRKLAEQGASIVFYKNLPKDVPGLADLQKRQAAFHALSSDLSFSTVAGSTIQKAKVGKGAFLTGDDLEQLLTTAKTHRETLVDNGLQYARRSYTGGHYYFISNPSKNNIDGWVDLQIKEKNILVFDPMTLAAGNAKTRMENGSVQIFLQLAAGSSCILQSGTATVKSNAYPYYEKTEQPQLITGKWSLQFVSGGPLLPANTEIRDLGSWTLLPGDDVKNFSGTAQYSIHFAKPTIASANYLLDLGDVQESAEIILNGKKIITLIGPSFQTMIPASLLKEDNLLQINVTNGMPNRIADLERKGVVWKKFYNTNFPSRLPQNRGADGIFTAAKWQPKPAGLLGPVSIQAVK
jgi:hypothetical protein